MFYITGFIGLTMLLLVGRGWEGFAAQRMRQKHAAPGKIVKTPKGDFHAIVRGARKPGDPAVVLDGGLTANSLAWPNVISVLENNYQVIAFDRLGHLWSGRRKEPVSCNALNEELSSLLSALGVAPPYIIVGHSYAGLPTRTFAGANKKDVHGIVLIDTTTESWAPLFANHPGTIFYGVAVFLSQFGVLRLLPKGKSKDNALSEDQMAAYKALSAAGRDMKTAFNEIKAFPPNADAAAKTDLADVDGIVIAAQTPWAKGAFLPKGMTLDEANADSLVQQKALSNKLKDGVLLVTDKSDHEVPWRDPAIVKSAVDALVERRRRNGVSAA